MSRAAVRVRKPTTPAQTDKILAAINLRYAVQQMADRHAQTERDCARASTASEFDESTYRRLAKRSRWQRAAFKRLLDAGLSAYRAEVYR